MALFTRKLRWKRMLLWLVGIIAVVGGGFFVVGCCILSAPAYKGPVTDHFDGEKFHNVQQGEHGFGALLKWLSNRDEGPWREWTDAPPGPPPPERVGAGELRVTFINHSTVLIQMDSVNILTDPVWSERVGPFNMVGPTRHRPPGIRFSDLPPIDAVLVSHNHYDHMDVPTLRRLAKEHRPKIFVGLGNAAFLDGEKIPGASDMDWWQETELRPGVTLASVPAEHFSGRGACDRNGTLWTGFVVKSQGGSVYFAGDTGYGPHFEEIGRRYAPIRLALLPIGAYRPRWFMAPVHIDPEGAVRAHGALRAATSVGIHYGTFAQADDGQDEPVQLLDSLVRAAEPRPRFWTLPEGEGREIPAVGR